MPVLVFRSSQPGPSLLLCGGLHGDETNGVEIARRVLTHSSQPLKRLRRGSVCQRACGMSVVS